MRRRRRQPSLDSESRIDNEIDAADPDQQPEAEPEAEAPKRARAKKGRKAKYAPPMRRGKRVKRAEEVQLEEPPSESPTPSESPSESEMDDSGDEFVPSQSGKAPKRSRAGQNTRQASSEADFEVIEPPEAGAPSTPEGSSTAVPFSYARIGEAPRGHLPDSFKDLTKAEQNEVARHPRIKQDRIARQIRAAKDDRVRKLPTGLACERCIADNASCFIWKNPLATPNSLYRRPCLTCYHRKCSFSAEQVKLHEPKQGWLPGDIDQPPASELEEKETVVPPRPVAPLLPPKQQRVLQPRPLATPEESTARESTREESTSAVPLRVRPRQTSSEHDEPARKVQRVAAPAVSPPREPDPPAPDQPQAQPQSPEVEPPEPEPPQPVQPPQPPPQPQQLHHLSPQQQPHLHPQQPFHPQHPMPQQSHQPLHPQQAFYQQQMMPHQGQPYQPPHPQQGQLHQPLHPHHSFQFHPHLHNYRPPADQPLFLPTHDLQHQQEYLYHRMQQQFIRPPHHVLLQQSLPANGQPRPQYPYPPLESRDVIAARGGAPVPPPAPPSEPSEQSVLFVQNVKKYRKLRNGTDVTPPALQQALMQGRTPSIAAPAAASPRGGGSSRPASATSGHTPTAANEDHGAPSNEYTDEPPEDQPVDDYMPMFEGPSPSSPPQPCPQPERVSTPQTQPTQEPPRTAATLSEAPATNAKGKGKQPARGDMKSQTSAASDKVHAPLTPESIGIDIKPLASPAERSKSLLSSNSGQSRKSDPKPEPKPLRPLTSAVGVARRQSAPRARPSHETMVGFLEPGVNGMSVNAPMYRVQQSVKDSFPDIHWEVSSPFDRDDDPEFDILRPADLARVPFLSRMDSITQDIAALIDRAPKHSFPQDDDYWLLPAYMYTPVRECAPCLEARRPCVYSSIRAPPPQKPGWPAPLITMLPLPTCLGCTSTPSENGCTHFVQTVDQSVHVKLHVLAWGTPPAPADDEEDVAGFDERFVWYDVNDVVVVE